MWMQSQVPGRWHPQGSGMDVPSGEEEVVLDEEGQEEVHHPFCRHGNQVLPNEVPLEWIWRVLLTWGQRPPESDRN